VNPKVLVSVVTFNSARYLAACLESLETQTYGNIEIRLWDNASRDGSLEVAAAHSRILSVEASKRNVGFCAAHNRIISSASSEYVLVLNPDVVLEADFTEKLVRALEKDPSAGSATGKLCRWSPDGIPDSQAEKGSGHHRHVLHEDQRHLDRGGRHGPGPVRRREYVFGHRGRSVYRRAMSRTSNRAEYFDESFFATARMPTSLRQWLGWHACMSRAEHVRRVLPERRASASVNMHSFKTTFSCGWNMDPERI
jgi:GT2 family glycosyltransferase